MKIVFRKYAGAGMGGNRRRLFVDVAGAWLPSGAAQLRVGTAAVKITPPRHSHGRLLQPAHSQGVLDDLYAKAAVLDDGKTKAALVACDLIGLPRAAVLEARRIIAEKTGIPADNVMISATHTHTGPVVIGDSTLDDDLVTGGSQAQQRLRRATAEVDRPGRGAGPCAV